MGTVIVKLIIGNNLSVIKWRGENGESLRELECLTMFS
jgi:hypothetical protein